MYKSVHEEHKLAGNDLPFIFHPAKSAALRNYPTADYTNWHTNIEIICCTDGKGGIICETERYELSKGDIFVVNSNYIHNVINKREMSYHCFIIDKTFFEANSLEIDSLYFKELISDKKLYDKFIKIAEAFENTGKKCSSAEIKYAALGFLILLCRNYATEKRQNEKNSNSERIKSTIKYIKKNLSSNLTLDEIASAVGVSKYHLAREFKTYTGSTIFEHINLIRCSEAKRLIKDGMSVSSAALSCGFSNMSYFTKSYKRYMGDLPSKDAQKNRKQTTPISV